MVGIDMHGIYAKVNGKKKLVSCFCTDENGEKVDIKNMQVRDLVNAAIFNPQIEYEQCVSPAQHIDNTRKLYSALCVCAFTTNKSFFEATIKAIQRLGGGALLNEKIEQVKKDLSVRGEKCDMMKCVGILRERLGEQQNKSKQDADTLRKAAEYEMRPLPNSREKV